MIQPDWIYGLIGGLLIGTAAALFLLVNGRIMGASGIMGEIVENVGGKRRLENIAFIAGVIIAPVLMLLIEPPKAHNISDNFILLIIAGLFVGVGTRMANGCTSGHGVCGISRLSVRGIVATLTFLAFGVIAMAILRHALGVI